MKTIQKAALTLLALGVAFTSGCGDRHSTKEVYYLISTNTALPYWQTAAAGFKKAAAEYKVTARVVGPDGYDPQAELAELQKAVAAKPSGILISVADAAVIQPGIDAAINAGIPVITMDSDAAGSRRLYFIGTNNLEAGRLGGRRVIEKLGGKGNVVFFTIAGQPNTEERLKGFKDVFASRPDIKIVDVVDIKGDAYAAFDRTRELMALTGPKKIDAFVCLDSASGKMVSDAFKRTNATGRELLAERHQRRHHRRDGRPEALCHGLRRAQGPRRGLPLPAQATQQGLQHGLLLALPGLCGHRHLARRQEQRRSLHRLRRGRNQVARATQGLKDKDGVPQVWIFRHGM